MAVGLGHKSFMQIGRESAYGTQTAATHRMEIMSETVDLVPGFALDASLNDQRERRGVYPAGTFWRGTIRCRMNYLGLGQLLDAVFGTDTFGDLGCTEGGSGPDAYTHEFTVLPVLNSYTIELIEGGIPDATKCVRLLGAKFRSITLHVEAAQSEAGMMTAEFEVIAKSKDDNSGAGYAYTGALTAAALEPVLFHHATTIDDGVNTTGIVARSYEIRMQQPTTEADRLSLGSTVIAEPIPSDFMTVTWRIEEDFQDYDLLDAAIAGTSGSPELVLTNASSHILTIRSSEAIITSHTNPINDYGIIRSTVEWQAWRSSTNPDSSGLYLGLTNSESTID